jgi:hypothetical protein
MGQYYLIVNLDKKQYLHPHPCGDGLKLLEFGCSAYGTLTALAILLADGNGRGGGDLRSTNPVIGSWAGDRVVIAGDYADDGKFTDGLKCTLFDLASDSYQDISRQALRAMADDEWIAAEMRKSSCWNGDVKQSLYDFAMGIPLRLVK